MKQIQIIGNLGSAPEKKIRNSKEFIVFSVAVSTGKNQYKKTDWFTCFSYQVGLLPYLKKGDKVFVQGVPDWKIYENNQNNSGNVDLSISCEKIALLGGKE